MRYLFVHQNFPGQFLHLVRHLLRQNEGGAENEIVFISEPNQNAMPGVRRVSYCMPREAAAETFAVAQEFELATLRADQVAQTARALRQLNYQPDIIIGHHGWGELLNLHDVFPDTPMLGYLEFYYHTDSFDVGFDPEFPSDASMFPRVRAKNAVNLLALTNNPLRSRGQTPTWFQRSTYPAWAHEQITVLPEGVDLDICRPDPLAAARELVLPVAGGTPVVVHPGEKLVTYVARDLEPYRGFHVVMRALPRILQARPDARIVLVGGDGVSYGARLSEGSWREYMLREVGASLDPSRVHFVGKQSYASYVALLQRSDAHMYLTYPFVASWSLREAMAVGCPIVASDTAPVQEFIRDRETGLLTPFHQPRVLGDRVLELLEDTTLSARLRHAVRAEAERTLSMRSYIANYEALIRRTMQAG
ncbi:glycosyltransferase family 4 protein [Lichenicoccus roseus]|uniref:Glycosyltransferase n=1 Tax=Lichenicoccus roseus TaxID=2683649 RepID=A0A5R9J6Y6_9PROT|nr:glycosyltransferase family 4 protein [Lichenicoccus roseus]TLU73384.1 glycosyltransferase [Lichenicoccus roseus]